MFSLERKKKKAPTFSLFLSIFCCCSKVLWQETAMFSLPPPLGVTFFFFIWGGGKNIRNTPKYKKNKCLGTSQANRFRAVRKTPPSFDPNVYFLETPFINHTSGPLRAPEALADALKESRRILLTNEPQKPAEFPLGRRIPELGKTKKMRLKMPLRTLPRSPIRDDLPVNRTCSGKVKEKDDIYVFFSYFSCNKWIIQSHKDEFIWQNV